MGGTFINESNDLFFRGIAMLMCFVPLKKALKAPSPSSAPTAQTETGPQTVSNRGRGGKLLPRGERSPIVASSGPVGDPVRWTLHRVSVWSLGSLSVDVMKAP